MKNLFGFKVGILAIFAASLAGLIGTAGVLSQAPNFRGAEVRNQLKLILNAQKQVIVKDENGKNKVSWQALGETAVVQPGDILLYTVRGEESQKMPVNNFVVTQLIPAQTMYVLNSAEVAGMGTAKMRIIYSIDGGNTFTENPTIQVTLPNGKVETQPAPADVYTHIRYVFDSPVVPESFRASYQVKVR
ncbi:hypothetical protein NG798_16465 [Ancylothrix sp. C2]|uniref:hypothetical protein n=1 Tax=Ancylothrix sp. D3o TaxID=2953691 RepID=UPI0021BB3ADF|nr:hypothetical protein [Ancylothrix sp. D3o]MCT7951396.1 hypothetical protein [Ancylothrix sp. D3o]